MPRINPPSSTTTKLWESAWLRCVCLAALLSLGQPVSAQTGTEPEQGIQSRPSRVTLFRNAHIVISPESELAKGDLLVRDDKISELAESIDVPPDAEVIDCDGKYLYPAFIDPLVELPLAPADRPDDHWNGHIQPHRRAHAVWPSDDKVAAQYRRAGFGAILIAPSDGILKGTSALVTTAKLPVAKTALRGDVFQHLTLVLGRQDRGGYPNSPMGVVALTRQTLSDAQWYQQAQQAFRADPTLPAPDRNVALEALGPLVRGEQTVMIDSGNELYALRADRMAREFSLRAIIRGSGREYRQTAALAALGRTFVVPVDFPKPPEVGSIEAATSVSLQSLMHWYLAPENPARLERAKVAFVLTANGLDSPGDLLGSARKAIDRGLSPKRALDSLTIGSAKLLEIDHLVGSLERGKLANLLVTSGPLWEKKSTIEETWVQGERYRWQPHTPLDPSGRWRLELAGPKELPTSLDLQLENMSDKPKGRLALSGQLDEPPSAKESQTSSASPSSGKAPSRDKAQAAAKDAQSAERAEAKSSDRPEKPLELKKPTSDVPPKDDSAQPPKPEKGQPGESASEAAPAPNRKSDAQPPTESSQPEKTAKAPRVADLRSLGFADFRIEAVVDAAKLDVEPAGFAGLSLTILSDEDHGETLVGRIQWPDGQVSTITGSRIEQSDNGRPDNDKSANDASTAKTKADQGEADKDKTNKDAANKADAKNAAPESADADKEAEDKEVANRNAAVKEKSTKEADKKSAQPQADEFVCDVNFPLGAFGTGGRPEQPQWLLVRGATIWTSDKAGTIPSGDLLVHRGVIKAVGRDLAAPEGAMVIDAKGKHVTAGIIDCHSHMATDGGVNESGQAVTAEVRIGDFIDSNDMNIYRQLAGGVTAANVLHGSANPIGGQNQVIKLRWGALDEEMKMREAPAGIKFALGENVKQSNWGERATGRYPQTRMGVEQIMRDRFEAAKLYREAQAASAAGRRALPPRRDYELEAISEILEHRRWIHCHSYRQDEILAFLRTLEDYGVTVGSLQHILEGYKVADEMARHGATGSTFSDWWAYKVEVIDAIPFNGAVMHQAGVVVSFNSDDNELGRHLNHEAAKAVKYGGVSPEEALKFVTLNPAKQLRIDRYVGSLAEGKQADFVIWSGSPLSTLSRCEQTWIDGRKYFDREQDVELRRHAESLRRQLVQRILDSGEKMLGDGRDRRDPSLWFARHDEFCHHSSEQAGR